MKKLLIGLSILLFGATQVEAYSLKIRNKTKRHIRVVLPNAEAHFNSINALRLAPGQEYTYSQWSQITGRIQMAFKDDMDKSGYPVWQTYATLDPEYKALKTQSEKNKWLKNFSQDALPTTFWRPYVVIEFHEGTQTYKFAEKTHKKPTIITVYPKNISGTTSHKPLRRKKAGQVNEDKKPGEVDTWA